jgi:hypothetical protein
VRALADLVDEGLIVRNQQQLEVLLAAPANRATQL